MPPAKRTFTKEEIDLARFFLVRIGTSGLDNPKGLDDAFDYSDACPVCKASRIPKTNLHIPTNSMGKKMLDTNLRYGYLIFHVDLIAKIKNNDLRGIGFVDCSVGRERSLFKEGKISNIFPRLADKSIVTIEDQCPECFKSGHYDTYTIYSEFWYKNHDLDNLTDDFYLTWEYYNWWKKGATHPRLIVSKKCKELVFDKIKQRHIKLEPIFEQE